MGIKVITQQAIRDWIIPSAQSEYAADPQSVHRSRLIQFLFSSIVFQSTFFVVCAIAAGAAFVGFVYVAIAMGIALLFMNTILCHFSQIELARKLVLLSTIAPILFALRVDDSFEVIVLVMMIPIVTNLALLSSPRTMWFYVGGIALIFNVFHVFFSQYSHPYQDMIVDSLIIIGIALTAGYGVRRFRISYEMYDQTLQIARLHIDLQRHSETITALNEQITNALFESESLRRTYETVFQSVCDILVVYDPHLRVQYVNHAAEKLFGEQSIIGKTLPDFYNAENKLYNLDGTDIIYEDHPVIQVFHEKTQLSIAQLLLPLAASDPVVLDVYAVPILDNQQQITAILQVMHDISHEYYSKITTTLLQNVAHVCSSAVDIQSIAEGTLQTILSTLQIVYGTIFVRQSENAQRTQMIATVSLHHDYDMLNRIAREQMSSLPIVSDSPLISFRALSTGEPIFDQPPTAELQSLVDFPGFNVLRFNSIPIHFDQGVQGVLTYAYTTETHRNIMHPTHELMLAIARELGVAFHRAQLYMEAQNASLFDALTSLRNYRSLQDILQIELSNSANLNLPTSVILIDINHFRIFNEEYGHDMGDLILRMIGQTINHRLRASDYAARYSGEEFVLVLPLTDSHKTHLIATDLKHAIEQCFVFPEYDASEMMPLSISVGHATFPRDASTSASLLKAAEIAVYSAKRMEESTVVQYSLTLLQSHTRSFAGSTTSKQGFSSIITLPSGAELDAIQALVTAIDLRDGYTAAHSNGVSNYAVALATALDLPFEHVEMLRLGGLIHDVGKIGVPDNVLRKPGKLTDEEWTIMRAHTTMGAAIMEPVEHLRYLIPLVRWHHERLDGSGYPDGLRGEEIPLLVQILAIGDVFEAFTAERPYHPGRSAEEGMQFLLKEAVAGRMRTDLVNTFQTILAQQGILQSGNTDQREAA